MTKKAILLLFFLFLFHISQAQVTLRSATITFVVNTIELYPVVDYTGGEQFIGLLGDKTRIDILWNAKYNPESLEAINVTCWLNCNNSIDITKCYGFQNCSYQGKTGAAACTIFYPSYNYSALNNITCKFSNPNRPELEYRLPEGTYPQRVFYPVKYSVSVSGGTYFVGKTISLPITFISYSFLSGNYTGLAYIDPSYSSYILIDNSYNTTNNLKYSQIGTVSPKITLLYVNGEKILYINTTASELPSCTSDNNCSRIVTEGYQKIYCIDGKCNYVFAIQIGSAYLSLPEYEMREAVIILVLATFLFLLAIKLKT
ncbi:MAG: hypothetical protein LM587_03125 [Candidatus Aenigmarchaeota archaeon]|nr:hypothetical protein [Candidatus Aenigmarchaeota archaeon]